MLNSQLMKLEILSGPLYGVKALNFSDYRQVSNYFAHKFLKNCTWKQYLNDEVENETDPMTQQSGS